MEIARVFDGVVEMDFAQAVKALRRDESVEVQGERWLFIKTAKAAGATL